MSSKTLLLLLLLSKDLAEALGSRLNAASLSAKPPPTSLAFHPSGDFFAMGGRLFKGQWNVALFGTADGSRLTQLDTKMRISKALWSADGKRLHLAGGSGQPSKPAEIENPSWGRVKTYEVFS